MVVEICNRISAVVIRAVGPLRKLRAALPLAAIEATADRIWRHPWFDSLSWTAAVVVCAFFVWRPQAPGVAAVALGGLAAIVTFRKMKATQKLLGTLLILALIGIEFRSIRQDRNEQRTEQAELQNNFRNILRENQESFARTEAHFESVLEQLKNVGKDITGGDSFAYIAPQDHDGTDWCSGIPETCVPAIPLVVWNAGNHALIGINIRVVDLAKFPKNAINAFYDSPIVIGILPPHGHQEIRTPLIPDIQADGTAKYWIFLRAQNGEVMQMLNIRKGKNGYPWGHSYEVTKQVAVPDNVGIWTVKTLLSVGWNDEPRPPTNPPPASPPSPLPPTSPPGK